MKYIALSILLTLVGCGEFGQKVSTAPITIDAKPIARPALNLPPIDRVRARDVEWIVITPENVDQVFAEMAENGDAVVVFALATEDYENLSLNTRETLQIIMQQQVVIDGYREYYLVTRRQIDEHNQNINQ
jgi:hypothetical protein